MRDLAAFVAETPIPELAERVSAFPIVQAAHVEPLPSWLAQWRRHRSLEIHAGDFYAQRQISPLRDDPSERPSGDRGACRADAPAGYDPPDFGWPPEYGSLEGRLPLLVRIHLCRARLRDATRRETGDAREQREMVVRTAREFAGRFFVSIEERDIARAAGGGDAIGQDRGTLGGELIDPTSCRFYGMTCAHVASGGVSVTDAAGAFIGTCVADTPLTPQAGGLCRPSTAPNLRDAALVALAPPPAPSNVRESQHFGSGMAAAMTGAASGANAYAVGSLALTQVIRVHGVDHCFRDLFSVRPLWCAPLPQRLNAAIGHRARRGDSGAWITSAAGVEWFGMLIAVDGVEAFACDACDLLDWARGALGAPLLRPY